MAAEHPFEAFVPEPDAAMPPHHALHAAERLYGPPRRAPRRDWARVTAWLSVLLVGGSLGTAAVVWKPLPDVDAIVSGAEFQLRCGLIEPARKDLDEALRREPDHGYAQLLRAYIDEKDGDYASALSRYLKAEPVVSASGQPELQAGWSVSCGILRLATGDFAGADADAARLIAGEHRRAAGFVIRAFSRLGQGDDTGWRQALSQAYSIDSAEPILRLDRDVLAGAIPWAGACGGAGEPGVVPGS